jgi:hypothetical protein
VATELYKDQEFAEAIQMYQHTESCCMKVLQRHDLSLDDEEEVEKQLSLCRLSRSLCHFQLLQYPLSLTCCEYVVQDKVSSQIHKTKAIIRIGQCFNKMAGQKGAANKAVLLTHALEYAKLAEKILTEDEELPRDLMSSTTMLLKTINQQLQSTKFDYAKGLNSLSEVSDARPGGSAASPEPSSKKPARKNQGRYDTSSSDSDSNSAYASNQKRRGATSSYAGVNSQSQDLHGNPYALRTQRFARFPGIRNEGATCWGNCILQVIYHIRSLRVRLQQVAAEIYQQANPEDSIVVGVLLHVFAVMDRNTAAPGHEALGSVSALSLWRACETNVCALLCSHSNFHAMSGVMTRDSPRR